MRNFKELQVWERAHRLTLAVYAATESFPTREQYGLTSQLRRAAASVPANIAEGCGKDGNRDFAHYLQVARGSATELEYHLLLARDLGLLKAQDHDRLAEDATQLKRMLTSFIDTLRQKERVHD